MGRFAGRLPVRTVAEVRGAAAAGRWERAVDELITALRTHAQVISVEEHEELRAVLRALNMPADRVDGHVQPMSGCRRSA
jgi:hypothetical protein